MEIRKLEKQDKFAAGVISVTAFHERVEDMETKRGDWEQDETEDWGAFDEDGTLMARIVNNRYRTWFDGHLIENGAIGAVSTLPEYRNSGAVRHIFEKLLPDAYRNGEIISTLYPFSHAFYRKFGYDNVSRATSYAMCPAALKKYRFDGRAVQWKPGDPVSRYTELYNRFASRFNLAAQRDDEEMARNYVKYSFTGSRLFTYMLSDEQGDCAYLSIKDVFSPDAAHLEVYDMAWEGARGFNAILGFLARFDADYGKIELWLPRGIDLATIIDSADTYGITRTPYIDYMIRLVNVGEALKLMRKPTGAEWTMRVHDDLIAENDGFWHISENGVEKLEGQDDATADMDIDIRSLGQLVIGATDLAEAMLKTNVTVRSRENLLRTIFVRKPLYMADHF